jgi:hypothetical protein
VEPGRPQIQVGGCDGDAVCTGYNIMRYIIFSLFVALCQLSMLNSVLIVLSRSHSERHRTRWTDRRPTGRCGCGWLELEDKGNSSLNVIQVYSSPELEAILLLLLAISDTPGTRSGPELSCAVILTLLCIDPCKLPK